jgi:hypothetical protein
MKKGLVAMAATVAGLAAAMMVFGAGPALAHEERTVGAYRFVVGFGDEPAYAGLKNSVQLILSDRSGKPITNLTDSLKVEVIFGTQKMQLPLENTFDPDSGSGTPGDYRAWFIPTAPGTYTFHFFGTIGKQNIDQSFTSGPTTFSEVTDPSQVEFPTKVPSGGDLAARLDREIPRLNSAIAAGDVHAIDRSGTARTLAIVGIAVGVVGLAAGGTALALGRRRP